MMSLHLLNFYEPSNNPPPPCERKLKFTQPPLYIQLFLKQLVPAGRPVKEFTRASHERKHISVLYLGHSHQTRPPFVVNTTCRSLLRLDLSPPYLSSQSFATSASVTCAWRGWSNAVRAARENSQLSACPSSRFQALDFHKPSEKIKSIRLHAYTVFIHRRQTYPPVAKTERETKKTPGERKNTGPYSVSSNACVVPRLLS